MKLPIENYLKQTARWPTDGRHILAHHDDETVIVYQAYRRAIGNFAIEHGQFGGEFSYNRMSWIKPNFLWMMYRSGWGTKPGQEITLALRLRRTFFDGILGAAVPSSFDASEFSTNQDWQAAVAASDVRLQWDPDHDPHGGKLQRRAVQLGLRGKTLRAFGGDQLLEVIDMSAFVAEQRVVLDVGNVEQLSTPLEHVYLPDDPKIVMQLNLNESIGRATQGPGSSAR